MWCVTFFFGFECNRFQGAALFAVVNKTYHHPGCRPVVTSHALKLFLVKFSPKETHSMQVLRECNNANRKKSEDFFPAYNCTALMQGRTFSSRVVKYRHIAHILVLFRERSISKAFFLYKQYILFVPMYIYSLPWKRADDLQ